MFRVRRNTSCRLGPANERTSKADDAGADHARFPIKLSAMFLANVEVEMNES